MGKTVDRMLKSAGLDTITGISTVEGDEDSNLTVTISLPAVLLICLLPLSMMSVEGIDMPSSVVLSSGSGVSSFVDCFFGSTVETSNAAGVWIRQTKLRYTFISIMKSN